MTGRQEERLNKTYTSMWTQEHAEAHVYVDGSVSLTLFDVDGKAYLQQGFQTLDRAENWLRHTWGEWDD